MFLGTFTYSRPSSRDEEICACTCVHKLVASSQFIALWPMIQGTYLCAEYIIKQCKRKQLNMVVSHHIQPFSTCTGVFIWMAMVYWVGPAAPHIWLCLLCALGTMAMWTKTHVSLIVPQWERVAAAALKCLVYLLASRHIIQNFSHLAISSLCALTHEVDVWEWSKLKIELSVVILTCTLQSWCSSLLEYSCQLWNESLPAERVE